MSYEVIAGCDHAYYLGEDVTPEQQAEKLNAEIIECKSHPEKCTGDKVTHYNIDLHIVLECFGTGENDTLEPTAEWSLIQERLKRADELEAELERVKAQRDDATRIVDEIWEMFYGQNLDVANWHQNGDLEPMNNFFEENDWLLDTTSESCRAAGGGE